MENFTNTDVIIFAYHDKLKLFCAGFSLLSQSNNPDLLRVNNNSSSSP